MSRDLNKCQFIGRLGQDVELRHMPNGTAVASLSLAVGDDYKDKQGNKVEQTEWVRVSAFSKLAEVMAEYLKKGSKVYIEGKMKTRKWDKDGQTHYTTEIIAENMQMLDSKNDVAPSKRDTPPHSGAQDDPFDDSIPF
jgi:single-strand DNA-binding protein